MVEINALKAFCRTVLTPSRSLFPGSSRLGLQTSNIICSSVQARIFSVIIPWLYGLWQSDPRKPRWQEAGRLQKSPQQAWALEGRHPGLVAIGSGG
jgi:hypothetical protein